MFAAYYHRTDCKQILFKDRDYKNEIDYKKYYKSMLSTKFCETNYKITLYRKYILLGKI